MPTRAAAAAFALVLVLTSCSEGETPTRADGTTSTSASITTAAAVETSTTAPADRYAVPAVITIEYVDSVLAALYKIDGDVVRKALSTGTVGPEDLRPLRAIYNDPQFEIEAAGLIDLFEDDRAQYIMPPGDRIVKVTRLVSTEPDCIVAVVTNDFSKIVHTPPVQPPDEVDYVALTPSLDRDDVDNINPTPWSLSDTETLKSGALPVRPCG